jgi:Flp pilus assembly protein CpaB
MGCDRKFAGEMMKNFRSWGLIGVSIVLAVTAALTTKFYLSHRESEIRAALVGGTEKVAVVVPTTDLNAGDTLHSDVVASRSMPKDMVPTGAISPDEFDAMSGLTLKQPFAKGTPVLRHLLVGANTDDSFSTLLKPGQRALTFTVDEKSSTSHLLRPGDYVDVVLAAKADEGGSESLNAAGAAIVKQHARVLAAGARTVADRTVVTENESALSEYQTITLAIETREVGEFLAAMQFVDSGKGTLMFLLRNPTDEGRTHIRTAAALEAIETFSGGNAKNGELNSVITGALSGERVAADAKGSIQLYQKYVESKNDENGNRLASDEHK